MTNYNEQIKVLRELSHILKDNQTVANVLLDAANTVEKMKIQEDNKCSKGGDHRWLGKGGEVICVKCWNLR